MPGPVLPKRVFVHARRVSRHPVFKRAMRSGSMIRKNFVRTAFISLSLFAIPHGIWRTVDVVRARWGRA